MLHGRGDECAALEALLERASNRSSGAIVLRGEAGIGKTSLLEHAAATASDRGMRVLRAAGVEAESELAYAGLHQLVRPLREAVRALPAPQAASLQAALGAGAGQPDRFAVSVAVLDLLSEASEEQPIVCLVDDAQWLDRGSADVLLFAARRMEIERVAMVFTARDGTAQRFDAPGLDELRVSGLDVTASAALLDERTGGALSPSVRRRIIAGSAGNPLALVELPGVLGDERLAGRMAFDGPLPLSDTLERSFLDRVRVLPLESQRLLLLAAAEEGGDEDVVLRAAVAGGLGAAATAALEESGLLRFRDRQVLFRHPLVRSAVYQRATVEQRHWAHGCLAEAFATETEADRRAWHRALATVGPDEDVAAALETTALRARSRVSHGAAARALARAADLSPDAGSRVRRLVAAAQAAWLAGQVEDAVRMGEEAERIGAGQHSWQVFALRGVMQLRGGNPATGCELLQRAALDAPQPLWLLMLAVEAASYAGRMDWMIELGERAQALPARTELDRFLRPMLAGVAATLTGDTERATEALGDALEATEPLCEPHQLVAAGTTSLHAGDVARALRFFERAEEAARAAGALAQIPFVLEMKTVALMSSDRYAQALLSAREGLELARETGQTSSTAAHLSFLSMLAAVQGRDEECEERAAECLAVALPRGIVMPVVTARWALGSLHLQRGRAEEALRVLDAASTTPGVFHTVLRRRAAPERFEAALRCGKLDVAREAAEDYSAWRGGSWGAAVLERFAAMLAPEDAEAERHFRRALALHEEAARPFEQARTQLGFGEWLRRRRRRAEARDHLRAALATFEQLGAEPAAERVREELRATGETARKRDPSTADALTAQERHIARLVAEEGMSNPQIAEKLFLSRRTVEYHLHKVYAKLGISSRADLAGLELA